MNLQIAIVNARKLGTLGLLFLVAHSSFAMEITGSANIAFDSDVPVVSVSGIGQADVDPDNQPAMESMAMSASSVELSSGLAELAHGLGSASNVFEWVRDNIDYVPYWGLKRGAEQTFLTRSGNDADQSVLMVTLLRELGYTAQYKRGLVTLSFSDTINWLGAADINSALTVFVRGGFEAGVTLGFSSSEQTVTIEYAWVYVDDPGEEGGNYFPAIKGYSHKEPQNMEGLFGYSRQGFLDALGGTNTADYSSGHDYDGLNNYLSSLTTNLIESFSGSYPNCGSEILFGKRVITPEYTPVHTFSLLQDLSGDLNEYTYYVDQIYIYFGTWYAVSVCDIGAKKLYFTYENGTFTLYRDDEVLFSHFNSSYPDTAILTYCFARTGEYSSNQEYPVKNGGLYVIALGDESSDCGMGLDFRRARFSKAIQDDLVSEDEKLAETLAVVGETFMRENAALQRLLSGMDGQRWCTKFRFGVFGQDQGYYTDVRNNSLYYYPAFSAADSNVTAFTSSIMMLSGFEHAALEQSQSADKPGISTVKIIKLANDAETPIYRLDTNNYAYASTNLTGYSLGDMNDFSSAVADGATLVVPRDATVSLNDWNGFGYFEHYDYGNGSQLMWAYIAGGYNGGYGSEEGVIDYWELYTKEAANALDGVETQHPEYGEPVDMVTGAYVLDHDDLVMDGPVLLRLARHYSSQSRNNKGDMGNGWVHSYNISASRHSAYDAGLGLRTPEDAASIVIASTVIKDLLNNEDTAQGWLAATLTANWAMEQLIDNAVSINAGRKVITFVEQPDGSFTPPPGMAVSLTETNSAYIMQERHGNTYEFNTNGLIETISDPDGNTLSFNYIGETNLQTVVSSFGPQFAFGYTGDLLTSVSDNSGRSVSYQYDSSNNLTNFVDAEGFDWGVTYDGDHKIKTLVDPEGITTIQNFYNDAGQVTNQISPSSNPWNYYFTGTRNVGEDPLGNQTAYNIDSQGRTWSIENEDGTRTYSFFDGQNHVTNTVNEAGVTNIMIYDVDHNLLALTNAAGLPEQVVSAFGYDAEHHLRFVTNALGTAEQGVTEYTYTATHHVDTITAAKGTSVEVETDLDYFSNGLIQQRSEGNGQRVTTYTYDAYGLPDIVNSTDAGAVDFGYNIRGLMASRKDAKGAETKFFFDGMDRMAGIEFPDGTSTTNTYWDNGLLKQATDARSQTTQYFWTPAYKPAGTVFPNTGSTTNIYDDADRLIAAKDAEDNWVTNTLDSVGRPVSVSSAYSVVTNQFDAVGNLTNSVVAPSGLNLWTASTYDSLNRKTSESSVLSVVENNYDSLGRTTNRVDAALKNWKTEFDELGRVKKSYRPSGNYEEYGYNALDARTGFWNAEFKPMTFGVDAQGRVTSITNAINKITSFTFDDAGNLYSRRDAEGAETFYGYDSLNRLTSITNDSVWVASFDHDNNGNITDMENDVATIMLGYDSMNRLTASTQSVYSVSSVVQNSFDLNGNRTHVTYPGGTNAVYVYGADNRLESVDLSAFGISTAIGFNYDSASRLTNIVYPNGVNSTFGLDAEGRVTSIQHGSFVDRTIQRNLLGFKQTELIDAGIKPTAPTTERRIKSHNDADQLVSEQIQTDVTNWMDVAYSYSANGCLTSSVQSAESVDYTYDYDNRIVSASSAGSAVEYLYDASGARVGRVDGTTTNYFVVDYTDGLKRPLAETDSSGSVTRYYIWSGMRLLCHIEANGDVYYYHSDELGSTLALTDSAGTVTDEFAYMPYGYANRTGTTDTPFQWLGGYGVYYDSDADLYLTLHRAYSSKLKRFVHPDPLGIDGGVNVYAYANLNPLFYTDPSGNVPVPVITAIYGAIAGGISGGITGYAYDGWSGVAKGVVVGAGTGGLTGLAMPQTSHAASSAAVAALFGVAESAFAQQMVGLANDKSWSESAQNVDWTQAGVSGLAAGSSSLVSGGFETLIASQIPKQTALMTGSDSILKIIGATGSGMINANVQLGVAYYSGKFEGGGGLQGQASVGPTIQNAQLLGTPKVAK